MAATIPLTLTSERSNSLWDAINRIPDDVLTDYLADNIIDEQEIEDITLRLERHMGDVNITTEEHALIRRMVRQAVTYIQQQNRHGARIEGALPASTLADVRNAMGHLLQTGQIALNTTNASRAEEPSPGMHIPDERPEDYDEEAPNLLE